MIVHPEVGKWLIALGEKAFGMDPFGWRIASAVVGSLMVLVMCRFVAPADRLDRCSAASPGCCSASTGCSSCCRGWRCSTSSWRSSCSARRALPGRRPGLVPRPDGRGRGGRAPRPAGGRARAAAGPGCWPAGVCFGLAVGTKWTALYPLAAFGAAGLAVERRRPAVLRRALAACCVGAVVDGVPAFVYLVLVAFVVYVATWTGWLMHADEYEEHAVRHAVHDQYGGGTQWPTATEPRRRAGSARSTQSLRSLWHYHHDVYAFHTHFLNDSHPHLRVQADRLAAAEPPGRRRRRTRHQARAPRAATRPRAATACARCCCSAPRRCGGAAAWRCSSRWYVGRRAGLALRGGRGRRRVDLAAVAAVRRPADLPLLRDRMPAVRRCSRSRWRMGELIGASDAPVAAAYGRRDRRRLVLRRWCC